MSRAVAKKAPLCPCGKESGRSNRYCPSCQAAYMRDWRKTHPMTALQRMKDSARSYVGVYVRRGKLDKGPCEVCGSAEVQAYHKDYSKPLLVRWLCRLHLLQACGKMQKAA